MRSLAAAVLLAVAACAAAAEPVIDRARFQAHVAALTAAPHRLAGTDEGRAAGDYILKTLRETGGQVFTQSFDFPRDVVEQCELRTAKGSLRLLPLRPNGLQPSVTPAGGLSGPLVFVGNAEDDALDGLDLQGALAVANLNARNALYRLFRLGASAVIFVGSPNVQRADLDDKRSYVSADLPRFYVSAEEAERFGLTGVEKGTILSRISWQKREGRNLFLWLPGRQPIFDYKAPEFVILSAFYDSAGLVPLDSPSMEDAANCAALLETAGLLARAQAGRRSVLISFFDNDANYHEGARVFYDALRSANPDRVDDPLPVRKQFVVEERAYLQTVRDYFRLGLPELLTGNHPRLRDGLDILKGRARKMYGQVQESLTRTRLAAKRTPLAAGEAAVLEARTRDLESQLAAWQRVREGIRDRMPVPESAQPVWNDMLQASTRQIEDRLLELDREQIQLDEAGQLTAALAGATPVMHVAYRFRAGDRRWVLLPNKALRPKSRVDWLDAAQRTGTVSGAVSGCLWDVGKGRDYLAHAFDPEAENLPAEPFEIPAATFITAVNRGVKRGVPGARFPEAALQTVADQGDDACRLLSVLLDSPGFSVPNRMAFAKDIYMDRPQWHGDRSSGHRVMSADYGDNSLTQPEAGVIVQMARRGDGRDDHLVYANSNGNFPVVALGTGWRGMLLTAARFDADGRIRAITTAPPAGGMASAQGAWSKAGWHSPKGATGFYTILCLFRGEGQTILVRKLPFSGNPIDPMIFRALNALSNSDYPYIHFRLDALTGIGVCRLDNPRGIKLLYQSARSPSDVTMLIHGSEEKPGGIGYGPGSEPAGTGARLPLLDVQTRVGPDLFVLDESRLKVFRAKNIVRNDFEVIHGLARQHLQALGKALAERKNTAVLRESALLAALEQRIYKPIVAMTNDMVVAVTILLLMALPFAFAIQSLVFPSHNIYRQMLGFAGVFLLSFGILYVVHPAFSFASMPVVIILGFLILILSGGVIWVIGNRFTYEVHKMQGLAAAAHTYETRIFGNFGAAVSLAISSTRRRPVRTGLTIATVLLLTFTILSFASFQGEKGINRFVLGAGDSATRMLVRLPVWKTLHVDLLNEYKRWLGGDFLVHGRYWKVLELRDIANAPLGLRIPVYGKDSNVVASAIMTLDAEEIRRIPAMARFLSGDTNAFLRGEGIFLSERLAKPLGLAPGDRVRVEGQDLKFLGIYDSKALMEMREIDGSPLLPVDFNVTQQALGRVETKGAASTSNAEEDMLEELATLATEALEPVSSDSLILAPTPLAAPLGLALKGVIVFPKGDQDFRATADQAALLNDAGVYANLGGERSFIRFGDKVGMSGLSDVLLPLLIGGLIVFSTMLGSILDREREIYTFSALGLAPRSIAMLFFVEATLYAVIGGFGGYLFSQVVTRVLELLAAFGLFRAPEMNYSSTTAINTILLVMATVIISTIYPAIQAARKATAETSSTWRIPKPQGDLWEFDFPFTISRHDVGGILCFLREHFAAHADRTVGQFAVDRVVVAGGGPGGLPGLQVMVWLQPFDEGISQSFALAARPSAIEEVCEIHVRAERRSGPPSSWQRANTLFLKDLRQQFLLWRTLDDDTMDHYLRLAETLERGVVDGTAVSDEESC